MFSLDNFNDLADELYEEVQLYEIKELSEIDVRNILFYALEKTKIPHPEVTEISIK